MKHIYVRNLMAKHYDRDPKNYSLDQLEQDYKNEVSKFSYAYLQGSKWYVGPSFKEYFMLLCINEEKKKKIYIR